MITLACISVIVSSAVSVFYAYLAYKKSQEPPKDEVWEAALSLCSRKDGEDCSENFARTYVALKAFKDNGYSYLGFESFADMMEEIDRIGLKKLRDKEKAEKEAKSNSPQSSAES